MNPKSLAALFSVLSNTVLVIAKLIVGTMIGSVSVISEAIHSGIDLLASIIALFSVQLASVPADETHAYGHGKIENVSGTVEALLIFIAAILIIKEAVEKLLHPVTVTQVDWGIGVMLLGSLMNFGVSRYLFRVAKKTDSIALEADAHHLSVDVLTSLGVFAGLVLVRITGWSIIDPIAALLVAGLIIKIAWEITAKSFGPVIDTCLPQEDIDRITASIQAYPEILEYHKLRTRKSGSEYHVDVHITVDEKMTAKEAHDIADNLEKRLEMLFGRATAVIHVDVGDPCHFTGDLPTDELNSHQ